MKRIHIFLLIFFLILIAIGIFGIARCNHAKASSVNTQSSEGPQDAPEKDIPIITENSFTGIDHAITPANLKSVEKEYEGFRISYNPETKNPNWVAWELLGNEVEGNAPRSNKFWHDEELEGCSYNSDYSRSGYDRGHMCPAADQKWSERAMSDCFVMANMCPQDHSLNTGAWNTLENKERNWAKRDSAIVIIAGPIFEKSDTLTIGQSGVRVPGAFFKVMVAPYVDKPRGIAFIYPNMTAPGNMEQYMTTIDEVEKITGIDFFYNLPDEIENAVESVSSFREWNKRK